MPSSPLRWTPLASRKCESHKLSIVEFFFSTAGSYHKPPNANRSTLVVRIEGLSRGLHVPWDVTLSRTPTHFRAPCHSGLQDPLRSWLYILLGSVCFFWKCTPPRPVHFSWRWSLRPRECIFLEENDTPGCTVTACLHFLKACFTPRFVHCF